MRNLQVAALAVLSASIMACGAAPSSGSREDVGQSASAIQGGVADTSVSDDFAVGVENKLGGMCSGTLIAPNLVLTARHCVVPPAASSTVTCDSRFAANVDPSLLLVTTSSNIYGAASFYEAAEIVTPASASFCGNDIALVLLTKNVPASEATPVTPDVDFSMADATKVSGQITAIGFGVTTPNATDSGERHIRQNIAITCVPGSAQYPCGAYAGTIDDGAEFVTDGWVCSGDSGSGAFDQRSFSAGSPIVLGALSRGPETDQKCLAAIYTRTDAHAPMIVAEATKAARAGGYALPSWAADAPSTIPPPGGTACAGSICTSTDATDPGDPETPAARPAEAGCSAAPRGPRGASAPFALVFAGLALALSAARTRRRAGR